MLLRCTLGAALILTIAACGQSLAAGTQSGHLAALAARQDLCDLICYAKADGTISQSERTIILKEAKSALPADEYATFKQTLDRIAPPAKPKAKQMAKAMLKKYKAKQLAKTTPKKPKAVQLVKTTPKKPAPVEVENELVIPASVSQPDGVAPPVFLR
jgi:hypothetical protein